MAPAEAAAGNPTLNISARTRLTIYLVTAIASIVVTYGSAKGWSWLGAAELAAWSSIVALVNGLAAINVRTGTK